MFKTEPLRKVSIDEHLLSDGFFQAKGFSLEQAQSLSNRFKRSQMFINPHYRVLVTPFHRPGIAAAFAQGMQLSIKSREGQGPCPLPVATELMRQLLPGYHGFTALNGEKFDSLSDAQVHLFAFKTSPFYLESREKGSRPLAQSFQTLWLGEYPEKTVLAVRTTVSFRSAEFVWAFGYPPFSIVDFVDADHLPFVSQSCLRRIVKHLFGSAQAYFIHATTPFEEFDRQVLVVDQGMGWLPIGV